MIYDPYVYIVRHELPVWRCGRFFIGEDHDWYDTDALEPFLETESSIEQHIGVGKLLTGPYRQTETSIQHDVLIAIPGIEMLTLVEATDDLVIRPANQEIFETHNDVYYADYRNLTRLEGEVLHQLFRDRHSERVANLERSFWDELCDLLQEELKWDVERMRALMLRLKETPPSKLTFEAILDEVKLLSPFQPSAEERS